MLVSLPFSMTLARVICTAVWVRFPAQMASVVPSQSHLTARRIPQRNENYREEWPDADDRNFSRSTIHKAALTANSSQDAELAHIPWARVHPRSFGCVRVRESLDKRTIGDREVREWP